MGEEAPDFELPDQHGTPTLLSSYRGQAPVLLVFYPYSFTGVCSGELDDLQRDLPAFHERGVVVLALSVDSKYSQRVFAEQRQLTFPLLADFWPHGAVARRYGVFDDDAGVARRATFLIDDRGFVRWTVVTTIGEARSVASYWEALASLDDGYAEAGAQGP